MILFCDTSALSVITIKRNRVILAMQARTVPMRACTVAVQVCTGVM